MNEKTSAAAPPSGMRRGVLFTGSGIVANTGFLFLETMIAVRLLSAGNYGIYVLLIALVNVLIVVVDFGLKSAVVQKIASSDPQRQSAIIDSALVFRLLVIGAISIIIWLSQETMLSLDPSPGVLLYAAYVPLMLIVASFDELLSAVLQGFQSYRHMAIAQIGRGGLRLCLTIGLLSVVQPGIMALIYSWIISFAASVVYQYLMLPTTRRILFFRRDLLREMLQFGLPLQLTRVMWLVFRRVDVLLLGTLAGPTSVAFYEVAARIPDALQRLSESYMAVYFPTMSKLLSQGQRAQAHWILNHSLRLISFLAALVALCAVLFSFGIVKLLFSEKYAPSAPVFALLMVAFHMTFIVNLMGYTLTAAGFSGRSFAQNLVRSGVNVVGDLLLIPIMGFIGPAYATLVAVYLSHPLGTWLLHRSAIDIEVLPCIKQTLLLLLCATLFWWMQPIEAAYLYKAGIIVLFVLLNLALSTISLADFHLMRTGSTAFRPSVPKESYPHDH